MSASIALSLPGIRLRLEARRDSAIPPNLCDDDEIHAHENREDDNADDEIAAHHESAERLEAVAGSPVPSWPSRTRISRWSPIDSSRINRRDQQDGRERRKFHRR